MLACRALIACLSLALPVSMGVPEPRQAPAGQAFGADALFQTTKVWTVHLQLSRQAWAALTPPAPPAPPPGPPPLPPSGGFVGAPGQRNGLSALKGLNFEYVHAAFDFDTSHFDDVAVRLKGNGTYTSGQKFNKPSFKIDLNKFVKGQKIGGVSTINLHNTVTDAGWMNEALAYRLYRDAGLPAPRTAYARVYVTVPETHARTYLGLYALVENVDEDFARVHFGSEPTAVFKPVTTALFKHLGSDWSAYQQIYDPKTSLTAADQQRIIDFSDLVSNASDEAFARRLTDFVDLDGFAKYMAVVVWLANPDSVLQQGQNYYAYLKPRSRVLGFVPWDQDHSFGQFVPFTKAEVQQQLNILHPWSRPYDGAPFAVDMPNRFLERTFALDAFRRPYLAALATLVKTVALPDRLSKQVDELAAAIQSVVAEEPQATLKAGFAQAQGEAPFPRPVSATVTVVPIKTFVRLRNASVLAQLRDLGVQ